MSAGYQVQREGAPGFFNGQYGGPRVTLSYAALHTDRQYNFLKDKSAPIEHGSGPGDHAESDDFYDNLYKLTGKRVQVILRDEKVLVGHVTSVDHFNNVVLSEAVERIVVGKQYGDVGKDVCIIRGENVVVIGEMDVEGDAKMDRVLEQVPPDEILAALQQQEDKETARQMKLSDGLKQRGIAYSRPFEEKF